MHQIRFQLGLRPIPRWGSLQRSPTLAAFKGPTSNEREGRKDRSKDQGRIEGKVGGGEGMELKKIPSVPPLPNLSLYTQLIIVDPPLSSLAFNGGK